MNSVSLEGVRCFRTRVDVPLRRITLLVGENSTGKSSFLALVRAAWDIGDLERPGPPNFNTQPFELGSYDSIAHYHGGKGKRDTEFLVGYSETEPLPPRSRDRANPSAASLAVIHISASFASDEGQPRMTRWRMKGPTHAVDVALETSGRAEVSISSEAVETTQSFDVSTGMKGASIQFWVQRALFAYAREKKLDNLEVFGRFEPFIYARARNRPYAIAPIRTRPARTYDAMHDQPSPDGSHVPVVLSRLSSQRRSEWVDLNAKLSDFGAKSGLFEKLEIRHLGRKKVSDPFQLEIGLSGQQGRRNIIDVGYGVSQALPIVVESLVQPRGTMFLVQQPEVHLHPRAQAELGSFIADASKDRKHQYIIETHSDYLVDRIALAIRKGVIAPTDVGMLFFQPKGSGVRVDSLDFDGSGDVVRPPQAFRQFFLNEQMRFLGDS